MYVIWHGQACFQILAFPQKGEQVSIVIDPFDETIGLKPPFLPADILLITHSHPDHNNKKVIKGSPFIIEGPGEYERKGVFLQGISSFHDEKEGKDRGLNTIYIIETEEIRLCHLGDLGQKELTPEQLDKINNVDVLMIPVGGVYTIDARGASKIISQIEPHIVIPMHYHIPKLRIKLDGLDKFLKEMGRKSAQPQPKLLIKKKDLLAEGTKIIILEP